ncbi:MAG: hypothetical protein QXG00_07765 [Candidatus Woesearchaeota archaeon]
MKSERIISAIDIGSNTILMLVAKDLGNKRYEILADKHSIARLSEGLSETGVINDQAIERAKKILKEYKDVCDLFGVSTIKSVATSAIREAKNGTEVSLILSNVIGFPIEIISGEEEANLSFSGTIENEENSTVIDIGGGSTEFVNGENEEILYKKSIKIGAVKITEKFFPKHPPNDNQINHAIDYIEENLETLNKSKLQGILYAVAGTPTTLAAITKGVKEYDFNQINGIIITTNILTKLFEEFLSRSVQDIVERYKIHPKRADVITAGTLLLRQILQFLQKDYFITSAKGLRFGVLKTILN